MPRAEPVIGRRQRRGRGDPAHEARRRDCGATGAGAGRGGRRLGDARDAAAAAAVCAPRRRGGRAADAATAARRRRAGERGGAAAAAPAGGGSSACGRRRTGTAAVSDGGGSGARTAGSRLSRSAMLVNWPGVTVFRLRN